MSSADWQKTNKSIDDGDLDSRLWVAFVGRVAHRYRLYGMLNAGITMLFSLGSVATLFAGWGEGYSQGAIVVAAVAGVVAVVCNWQAAAHVWLNAYDSFIDQRTAWERFHGSVQRAELPLADVITLLDAMRETDKELKKKLKGYPARRSLLKRLMRQIIQGSPDEFKPKSSQPSYVVTSWGKKLA